MSREEFTRDFQEDVRTKKNGEAISNFVRKLYTTNIAFNKTA